MTFNFFGPRLRVLHDTFIALIAVLYFSRNLVHNFSNMMLTFKVSVNSHAPQDVNNVTLNALILFGLQPLSKKRGRFIILRHPSPEVILRRYAVTPAGFLMLAIDIQIELLFYGKRFEGLMLLFH